MKFIWAFLAFFVASGNCKHLVEDDSMSVDQAITSLEDLVKSLSQEEGLVRVKRQDNRGVTNLDIRDAILQLLTVIREGGQKADRNFQREKELGEQILSKVKSSGSTGLEKKIDNISQFLLRMSAKLESVERKLRRGGGSSGRGGGSNDVLETLAQESFDILTLLPTYIENTKDAVTALGSETNNKMADIENLLIDADSNGEKKSLAKVLRETEKNIMGANNDLKDIVIESGHMAESLFENVNDGYKDLSREIKGLSNVEQVLLDTADSVMDTKRKIEFGVQQIIFKVGELVSLSGGKMDDQLKEQFAAVTKKILSNQNEAMSNLTMKVEKEIGQVWRQMGIMYRQVSNSISILEKVKTSTESYVSNTGKNLGTMEGQVEGLTDRMVDVDSNLNYMLGQLSLVVQEFNQVKTGLSDAMTGLEGEIMEEIKEYKKQPEA